MALVYLKSPSDWTLSSGLRPDGDTLGLNNLIAEDRFDDSNINTSLWGTSIVQGGGLAAISEDSKKLNIKTTASNSGAIAYYKAVLSPRATKKWRINFSICTPEGGIITSALVQDVIDPYVDSIGNIQDKELAEIAVSYTGGVYFGYWNTSGQRYYWNSGTGWSINQDFAYHGILEKNFVFEFENNGVDLIFRILKSDESEILVNASISWSSVRVETDDLYLYTGDPFSNMWYGEMDILRFKHIGDYPAGQVAIMGETEIGTFVDQVPISESLETGASIKWRYSKDGNGFVMPGAGDLVDLKEAVEGVYFNTLDLEAAFATDGLAFAAFDVNGGVLGSNPPLSFNLPLEVLEHSALEVIEI